MLLLHMSSKHVAQDIQLEEIMATLVKVLCILSFHIYKCILFNPLQNYKASQMLTS